MSSEAGMDRRTNALALWAKSLVWGSVLMGSMAVGYTGVSVWRHDRRPVTTPRKKVVPPVNPFASANGKNLIAFVITASDCGWAQQPSAIAAARTLRAKLRSAHWNSYAKITVIGVALDQDLAAGLRFLSLIGDGKPSGAFDQIMLGGSWLNEQVVRLVWRDAISQAASPQVIVVERLVNTSAYVITHMIGVQNDKLVANPVGDIEIRKWIGRGFPLDTVAKQLASDESSK